MSKKTLTVALVIVIVVLLAVSLISCISGGSNDPASPSSKPGSSGKTPTSSTEPTPDPYAFRQAPGGYFDDALFIGDSRTVGIQQCGGIDSATYFCSVGMSVYGVRYEAVDISGLGSVTLQTLLQSRSFGKVYIMLGINDIGGDLPTLAGNYQKVIDLVREYCPDAIIYVEANIHVSANPAAVASVNNTNINAFNELLKGLCDGKTIFYLDVNPVFDDANGNLGDEYSSDGIHFSAQYYKQWADWIAQNAIVLK